MISLDCISLCFPSVRRLVLWRRLRTAVVAAMTSPW